MTTEAPRRRYLRAAGAGLAGWLAGCTVPSGGATSDGSPPDDEGTRGDAGNTDGSEPPSRTGTPIHTGYETTRVRVLSPEGDRLGAVTAAVADTSELRSTGLSDTGSLPEDRGMLFVYDEVGDHTYVMRKMDFGLDIVYADAEGTITRIHHAPAPGPTEDGNDQRYPGRGQYVLEVNYGWTTDRGVEVGDRLAFDL